MYSDHRLVLLWFLVFNSRVTPVAILLSLMLLGPVLVAACGLAYRLVPENARRQWWRWLLGWSLKGLLAPAVIWTLMNVGLSWSLPPFMPAVQAAQNRGAWLAVLLGVLIQGGFVLASCWSAVTLAWMLARAAMAATGEARSNFKGLFWTCFIGMLVPALIIALLGGWPAYGLAAMLILVPMAGYAPGILHPPKHPPMYARAIARIKFGKYAEAEWEIIRELEKCEDDFEGWLMMADLYANHFHDLGEAEQTVLEICDHPNTTAPQLAVALHRLADWQLKLAGDPDAARRALQMICDRLPGTHLARMAQLRINQLPVTAHELREQRTARAIHLPALGDSLDNEAAPSGERLDPAQASRQASAYRQEIERNPGNVFAREKLARLLAEQLDQVHSAIEQLRRLLQMPEQDEARRAEWLGLIAAWQIKRLDDPEAGRRTLEQIIREFPQTTQALAARRRIQLLDRNYPS
jgi:hypothetical protein